MYKATNQQGQGPQPGAEQSQASNAGAEGKPKDSEVTDVDFEEVK
jgi:hypothetical protein